jgi:hypothetical protein
MSIYITKRPVQLVNGHQYKWLPAHQPIKFEIQRIDATVIQQQYIFSGGVPSQIRLTINVNLTNSNWGVKVGQKLTYFTAIANKTLTILSVGTNFVTVKFDNVFNSTSGGEVLFNDINYHIETTIFSVDKSNTYQNVGKLKSKTNLLGISQVSVQDFLSTKCINQNDFLYNEINKGIAGEGSRFNVQVREYYNSIPTGIINVTKSNLSYFTNSANQIQNEYGYNMGNYVPTLDATRTDKAKFQSVFSRPTYFVAYPFSLNFIYSDNMLNYQLIRVEDAKDINGTIITNTTANLNLAHRELANRLMLDGTYTSNIKFIDIWLETGEIIDEQTYVDLEYTASGYFALTLPNNEYTTSLYE